jgi:replication-associated recombination protein RarA
VNPIVIHPTSKRLLENLQANLPQSLLLSGPKGIGLSTIATWFSSGKIAGHLRPQDVKEKADNENGTISVEMIRQLYHQTRAHYTAPQIIIIDDADRMSRGAQNAFLKLLEEPGKQIYFILTSHSPQNLLPTVRSRTQHIMIQALDKIQSSAFIDSLGVVDPTKRAQLQFIAGGLPAELKRLSEDGSYFAARSEIVGDARDFLQANTYKKMLIVQKYRSDRSAAIQLIDSAMQILRHSITARPQPAVVVQLKRLLELRERIASNHNIPLQLASFVI